MIDHRQKNFRRIFCITPGCGQVGELLDHTTNGMAPALIEHRFTQKGWEVGRDSSEDFCPSCVATRQAERRAKRFKAINLKAVDDTATQQEEAVVSANGVEAPNEMTRAERRIIFAKLEEVYEDEDKGYKTPWTDVAVAKDLGSHIPVAWVAQVREENFGPVKDNSEIRDMLGRVEVAATEAKFLLEEARKHRTEVSALVESHNALMKRCTEIGKTLDGLITIADRIGKAVRA